MTTANRDATARARVLAWAALACAIAAVAILIVAAGLGSAVVVAIGVGGLALSAAGAWWALTHRGVMRVLGALVAVAGPIVVVVIYASNDLWPPVLASMVLGGASAGCARAALVKDDPRNTPPTISSPRPHSPVLIMNPKSGGGKVGKFGLVAKAESLGAKVVLLDTSKHQDVAAIARTAIADGADLIGVAGGDGTQALVAAVAASHHVPFLVISAGTRNHFAMDLGLDRDDPSLSLDALGDGVELLVDLGQVGGRAFVNSASFGAYAEIVQSPDYRDAKTATALDALPNLLAGERGAHLSISIDGAVVEDPQTLLVSNNPYTVTDRLDIGRRPRLDSGVLGVLAVRVTGAAQFADVALRGVRADAVRTFTAHEVVVSADTECIPVALDGEALSLATPVRCSIKAGALRVRVPKHRPGVRPAAPTLDWRRLGQLALGRAAPTSVDTPHG